jgi:glycosyltransferase involved in cell wall biosynthesis
VRAMGVCPSGTAEIAPRESTQAVLLVHNAFSRFVRIDCELLAKKYQVTVRYEDSPKNLSLPEIWRQVKSHDLVYCWFASWHSFLPVLAARLQGKPSVVVVGGYDTASLPQAGYGSQRSGFRKHSVRLVMRLASHLITNSHAARLEAVQNAGARSEKVTTVYHGIVCRKGAIQSSRKRMALTVGVVCRENLLRKGLLPFVQASHLLPDVRFVHAGPCLDDSITELRRAAGANVEFLGLVSDEKLAELYDHASVYVQASLHEGFGMSLAEAMAAGCIPVTTCHGSLPEVVGETGISISCSTPEAVAEGIASGLGGSYDLRLRAQARIQEMFSLEQREDGLREVLDRLLSLSSASQFQSRATKPAIG